MTILDALLLGLVQGLTEFLPVSSSGHIELGKSILNSDLDAANGRLFTIIVHGATALSTIVIFRKDIAKIMRDLVTLKWTDSANLLLFIVISMVPAALVGLLWKDELEALFDSNLPLVGSMLLVTGGLLLTTSLIRTKKGVLNYWRSFVIGIAQAVAILPGISRSGSTIAVGLLLGVNKAKMARFSFLMVLPLIFGLMAKDLMDYDPNAETSIGAMPLIIGFIAAFIAGLFACTWMIQLVKKSKLYYFAIYCFIVGAIALTYSFM